jgi:FkbM family methyltransferase
MNGRRIAPDDHRATIEHFLSLLPGPLATVVHVGAHAGEEVDAYRRHGAHRIILVEANPISYDALIRSFGSDHDVEVVHAAVTDHHGTERLLLHTNAHGGMESASLLPMKRLGEIVSTLHTERAVDVPATTLDALLDSLGVESGEVELLVVDVQGAELAVLRGASLTLRAVPAVLTEVALIELYEGAAREEDIERVLAEAGFTPAEGLDYELYEGAHRFLAWGDRLYVRDNSPPRMASGAIEPWTRA